MELAVVFANIIPRSPTEAPATWLTWTKSTTIQGSLAASWATETEF
jgi:hypothetical protein